jgi:hypothetical protein
VFALLVEIPHFVLSDIVPALSVVHMQHTHAQTKKRNETCDNNNHIITQLILEKHAIKLDFIHHNNLMHINIYRLRPMACASLDTLQQTSKS